MKHRRDPVGGIRALLVVLGCVCLSGASVAAPDPFPHPRPATRAEAIEFICTDDAEPAICVRTRLRRLERSGAVPSVGRALELLSRGVDYASLREFVSEDDVSIRFTTDAGAFDGVRSDRSSPGIPDSVEATAAGLTAARALLIGTMELPDPGVENVLLVELGYRVDGYPIRSGRASSTLILDSTPPDGVAGARRTAIRLFAYTTANGVGPALPSGWAEAFAEWALLTLDGTNSESLGRMSERLARMDRGLLTQDPRLAAGNALWFSFIEEQFGRSGVRVTLEELASSQSVTIALDRAMRRIGKQDLASALREFHLWTVLTGSRADGNHWPFAAALKFPGFAATSTGLPALSVHREPAVSPLGTAQIRLVPQLERGGLRLRFEGEFSARWEVDLLLVGKRNTIHRLPLPLSPEGRGEMTVPVDDLDEALLLVRNLDAPDATPQRYTYSAHHDRSFPLELTEFDGRRRINRERGVVLSWQTSLEQDLVGFNILRRSQDGAAEATVNPVWVPALGLDTGEATTYQFVDPEADPDVSYQYRIQAITTTGLSSYTDRVFVPAANSTD